MMAEDTTRDRKLMTVMATFGVICVIAAIVLLVVLNGDNNDPPAGSGPTGTVRQFLTVAAGEDNGDAACRYLTEAERLAVERAARETASCSAGFNAGSLTLGGKAYSGDLKALAFTTAENGGHAVVTVSSGASSVRFGLTPATKGERNEFGAPATPWRIDSGAAVLVSQTQDSS